MKIYLAKMDTFSGYIVQLKSSVMERLSGLHQRVGDSSALDFWREDTDIGEENKVAYIMNRPGRNYLLLVT